MLDFLDARGALAGSASGFFLIFKNNKNPCRAILGASQPALITRSPGSRKVEPVLALSKTRDTSPQLPVNREETLKLSFDEKL